MDNPFPLPDKLSPALARVMAYWEDLKRGGNAMPFWDDVNLSMLPEIADSLLLIDAFAGPERFRFNYTGKDFRERDSESLGNKFADEIELQGFLKYMRSQCSATVEAREPTFYRHGGSSDDPAYSRILMPMWGDGHISMLLGALDRN